MKNIKIIDVEEKGIWNDYILKSSKYDFYHTADYHALDRSGDSKLFVFQQDNTLILFPFIKRKIDSMYYDAGSVYGYCGPLSNVYDIPLSIIKDFQNELKNYFHTTKIISASSRLHPLYDYQKTLLTNYGTVKYVGKTVSINLNLDPNEQRTKYSRSLKNRINKLIKNNISIYEKTDNEGIDKFMRIYNETMTRLDAHDRYYFEYKYYFDLINSGAFKAFLLFATDGGNLLAGGLFTVCNNIMQYHLGGTKSEYLKLSPFKLILDFARTKANELNLDYFHLGGGVSGLNDSLFNFKKLFSKETNDFNFWELVLDQQIYNELINEKFGAKIPESEYFPLYRYR